jgi:hypothetical protein
MWSKTYSRTVKFSFPFSTSATEVTGVKEGGQLKEIRDAVASLKARVLDSKLVADIVYVTSWSRWEAIPEGLALQIHNDRGRVRPAPVADRLFPRNPKVVVEGLEDLEERRVLLYGYTAMALRFLSLLRRSKKGDLPGARQHTVEERGEKSRVITPITGCVSYMAQILNSLLRRDLDRDRRLNTSVESPAADVVGWDVDEDEVIRSVDMSSATDRMPLPLVTSMAEGYLENCGWPQFFKDALRLTLGPYRLLLTNRRWITTSCGILMGCGSSWPFLNLYNLWLWEYSMTKTGSRRLLSRTKRGRVRCVGDDLLGVAPQAVSSKYTVTLVETNGSPSAGKDCESRTAGCLVEDFIVLGKNGLELLPTVPGTLLECSGKTKSKDVLPPWACGPLLSENLKKSPIDLVDILHDEYKKEISMLRKTGLAPFVPRELGGGGFPCRDVHSAVCSLRPKWARAIRCLMTRRHGTRGVHASSLIAAWSTGSKDLLTSNERESLELAGLVQVSLDPVWKEGTEEEAESDDQQMTLAESVELACAIRGAIRSIEEPRPSASLRLLPWKVRRNLDRALERLNSFVPYPRLTDRPRDLWKGWRLLVDELQAPVTRDRILSTTRLTTSTMVGGSKPYDLIASTQPPLIPIPRGMGKVVV